MGVLLCSRILRMTIIGFHFNKLTAEKLGPAKGKISVNRSCKPTDVKEVKIGTGQNAIQYDFSFSVTYTPKVASIDFTGQITQLLKEDEAKQVLESWKKNKVLPPKTLERIMNAILNKCHVEALLMSKELNIPPPLNLPKVEVKRRGPAKSSEKASEKKKKDEK